MSKRGLILTLVAASVAMGLSGRSFAMAPVIRDPGDVIIGDAEGVGADNFNYPDSFNLLKIGSDDSNTSSVFIKWSYYANPGTITINGVPPLPLVPNLLQSAVNPPEGLTSTSQYRIDLHDYDLGNPGQDASPYTVTFRNANLSPIGGPNSNPYTGVNGILTTETQTITLFASDCTTASMRSVVVYSANATSDSVSGGQSLDVVRDDDFPQDTFPGWVGGVNPGTGTISTAGGLCMGAPLIGANVIGWFYLADNTVSPIPESGYITLVDQNVWRVRTTVTTSNVGAVGTAPFFDFSYWNQYFGHDPNYTTFGAVKNSLTYGGEVITLDNQGGANGPVVRGPGVGRDKFDFWISPAAMLLPTWRGVGTGGDPANSAFNTREDARNDMNLNYRLIDVDAAGIGAELDSGTICVTHLTVERANLLNLWNPNDTSSIAYGPPLTCFKLPAPTYAGPGTLHIPADNTGLQDYDEVNSVGRIDNTTHIAHYKLTGNSLPGSRKTLSPFDTSKTSIDFNSAFYPVQWQSNKLYLITMDAMMDPTPPVGTASETNPPTFYEVIGFEPTIETLAVHLNFRGYQGATPAQNYMFRSGAPRLPATVGNVPQRYVGLYYTQNKTVSLGTDHPDRIAPRAGFFNPDVLFPDANVGTDPVAVTDLKMYDITASVQ